VLPAALLFTPESLFSATGGLAAAIAVGAFFGQVSAIANSAVDEDRRRKTALGGLAGAIVLIGLLLASISGS
jgi:predicted tellurium resistance membrane protein TerC